MRNLFDGIYLEERHIFVEYKYTYSQLVQIFFDSQIEMDLSRPNYIGIKSRLLKCNCSFAIVFFFDSNHLKRIAISPIELEMDIRERYKDIQKQLKAILGAPQNVFERFLSSTNPNYGKSKWYFKEMTIEHLLDERFGLHDSIYIRFS